MRIWVLGFSVVLAVVGGACGGDLDNNASLDTTAGGEVVAAQEGRTVNAILAEWSINIPNDTLTPGRYTFRVQNSGQYAHALEVEGQGEEQETDPLAPAASGEVTVELTPGSYELYCPIEDARGKHRDLGMRRRLIVTEKAPVK